MFSYWRIPLEFRKRLIQFATVIGVSISTIVNFVEFNDIVKERIPKDENVYPPLPDYPEFKVDEDIYLHPPIVIYISRHKKRDVPPPVSSVGLSTSLLVASLTRRLNDPILQVPIFKKNERAEARKLYRKNLLSFMWNKRTRGLEQIIDLAESRVGAEKEDLDILYRYLELWKCRLAKPRISKKLSPKLRHFVHKFAASNDAKQDYVILMDEYGVTHSDYQTFAK